MSAAWRSRASPAEPKTARRAALGLIGALLCAGSALAGSGAAEPVPSNAWSRIATPTAGPPLAIGGFAHGCISGAVSLPVDGEGYTAIRLSRHRTFGHPDTVAFVEGLGRHAHALGLQRIMIGDMGQPRGGPLPFGHASHQIGMDVDIWFTFAGRTVTPPAGREAVDLPSMLRPDDGGPDPARFGPQQIALLRLAATDPRVDRIFVSPALKLAMCRGYGGVSIADHEWLHRISPWWGHDDHFHVRLACPAGSPLCEAQPPVPPGDGCDAGLEHWAHHLTPPGQTAKPPPPRPPPTLPAACHTVLEAPDRQD